MKRIAGILGIAAAALLLSLSGAQAAGTKVGSFKLKDGEGKEVTHEALKEKRTLFIVAQTACSQCRTEIKEIQERLDEVTAKAQVWVILVDANAEAGLERYGKLKLTLPVLLDPDFRLPASVGIEASPATFIVDGELNVVFTKTGYGPGSFEMIMEKL